MDKQAIEDLIENICERGCTEVNQIINELKNPVPKHEWSDIDATDRQIIAQELISIMAVYQQ